MLTAIIMSYNHVITEQNNDKIGKSIWNRWIPVWQNTQNEAQEHCGSNHSSSNCTKRLEYALTIASTHGLPWSVIATEQRKSPSLCFYIDKSSHTTAIIQIFSDCNTEKFNQLFFWLSSVAFEIVCQLIHGLGQYQGSTRFWLWWLQRTQANGDECWHHTYIAFLLGHFSNRKIQLQWTDFNQYWAKFIIFLLYIFITQ